MTNDKSPRKSFLPVPNDSHFPLANLPWGIFRRAPGAQPTVGVALGDQIVDLHHLALKGYVTTGHSPGLFTTGRLNELAGEGPDLGRQIRSQLQKILAEDCPTLRDQPSLHKDLFYPQKSAIMDLPFASGGFTDFYSSINHASNVGRLFRDKDNPLLPNWRHLPVAYNGRASTLVPSGTPIPRPKGQISPGPGLPPVYGPSQKLDFELELGYYIGVENPHGTPIPVDRASEHIFGLVLVNDWSARDHQAWEYVPLGPFLSKSFATSVSPWVVSPDALKPFLRPMASQDPKPLAYLCEGQRQVYDVTLEVWLTPAQTGVPQKIATTNTQELYWSLSQQIAHHTVNGCKLQIGDLLATGTISGPTPQSLGSLLEMTLNGTQALQLPGGLSRRFLEDLDEVALVAYGQGQDYRIGFGEVRGKILPAPV